MNSELEQNNEIREYTPAQVAEAEEAANLELSVATEPGTLSTLPPAQTQAENEQWREYGQKALRFLVMFPDYLNEALGEYKKPLITLGIILGAALAVAIADGILDRLNTIPLFAPTFDLIGLGFTAWIVFRYLLYADTRQELVQEYQNLKHRITGTSQ